MNYLPLFCLVSVADDFEWFCMGSLYKNIQVILVFLRAPFLTLHFSYYTSMAFLMMLSVILLSILITLCSKCDQVWFVARTRIGSWTCRCLVDTADWGRKLLVDYNAGKTQLVSFGQSNNSGAIEVKVDGSVFEEKYFLRCCGCLSLLNRLGPLNCLYY